MAQARIIEYVDDMDGKTTLGEEDATGFRFARDGVVYELDTTAARAEAFNQFTQPYVDAARKVGKVPTSGPYAVVTDTKKDPARTNAERERNKKIRAWALANGHELADRGRIPLNVIDAYEIAMKPQAATPKPAARPRAAAPKTPAKVPAKRVNRGKTPAAAPAFKSEAHETA